MDYYTEGYFKYQLSDGNITLLEYFGNEEEVVIPFKIGNCEVTSINSNCFHSKSIKTIVIPESITSIDDNAFSKCENLKKIINQSEVKLIIGGVEIVEVEAQFADKEVVDYNATLKPAVTDKGDNSNENLLITEKHDSIIEKWDYQLNENDVEEDVVLSEEYIDEQKIESAEYQPTETPITPVSEGLSGASCLYFAAAGLIVFLVIVVLLLGKNNRKR